MIIYQIAPEVTCPFAVWLLPQEPIELAEWPKQSPSEALRGRIYMLNRPLQIEP
jgi:hypothetical protein